MTVQQQQLLQTRTLAVKKEEWTTFHSLNAFGAAAVFVLVVASVVMIAGPFFDDAEGKKDGAAAEEPQEAAEVAGK